MHSFFNFFAQSNYLKHAFFASICLLVALGVTGLAQLECEMVSYHVVDLNPDLRVLLIVDVGAFTRESSIELFQP